MFQQIKLVWRLSLPAILAQLTSILMQYIDAAMVGRLGANASASIGLVSTSIWLLGGFCSAVSTGFSVQVAHSVGAGKYQTAKQIFRLSLRYAALISCLLSALGISVSFFLPAWLGGSKELWKDSSAYFLVCACAIPLMQMNSLAGSMLQCSGNMKVPGILESAKCLFDILFNAIFIFGLNFGVMGAALGTAAAQAVTAMLMLYFACVRSPILCLSGTHRKNIAELPKEQAEEEEDTLREFYRLTLLKAVRIGLPVAFEHAAICGAMVVATHIVAPLGSVAIAANSFAVTAESFCYMPGFGVGTAATTLVGQSLGAGDKKLAKCYAWLSTSLGMLLMTLAGVCMYFLAPAVFRMLTPIQAVQELGTAVLRIELFAEPFYAASIVASGALRGAGDTLVPSIMNLVSIWGVRLTLSVILVSRWGLHGVWFAMCTELTVRGILLLFRLWQKSSGRAEKILRRKKKQEL